MREIAFTRAAKQDRKSIPPERRGEIGAHLERLARGERENLDIEPIQALKKEWSRLRVGSYRVVFRERDQTIEVARVVSRQELEDAIRRMQR